MQTIKSVFSNWHAFPSGLHQILIQAGYPAGVDGIWRDGNPAADARISFTGHWTETDVAGPLDRPDIRLVRIITVYGPAGMATGRIMR